MPKILQLKITLLGSKPPIWRRILVEDSITFHRLHNIIQGVMGWDNYHLYEFKTDALSILVPHPDYSDDFEDSKKISLDSIIREEGQKFGYIYDFGDNWKHLIVVEKILEKGQKQKYPFCLAGERSCPPEDCGGIWGYEEFLEAINNPKHMEHEDMLEWIGGEFDSGRFDIDEINKSIQGG